MSELRIFLMGTFRLDSGGGRSCVLHTKAQELLAIVLLAPRCAVRREVAAAALWPDVSAVTSRRTMRQALWQIHREIDADEPAPGRLVLSDGDVLTLNAERPVWVDAHALTEAADLARATDNDAPLYDDDLRRLAKVAELYQGPVLPGCDDAWCLAPRARLDDHAVTVLEAVSREHERRGALNAAVVWAQRTLEVEPAHERTHRRLMLLHYRTGDRTRALRQLERCRSALQRELEVRPSRSSEELGAAIRAGVPPESLSAEPASGLLPRRDVSTAPDLLVVDALETLRAELAALRRSVEALAAGGRASAT